MQKTVNIDQAKEHLLALIAEAMAGNDIVIARNGEPWVRLVPVRQPKRIELGFLSGVGLGTLEFDDVADMDEWEAEWDGFYPADASASR